MTTTWHYKYIPALATCMTMLNKYRLRRVFWYEDSAGLCNGICVFTVL